MATAEEVFLSDIVLKVNPPEMNNDSNAHEIDMMKSGTIFVSFFQTTKDTEF